MKKDKLPIKAVYLLTLQAINLTDDAPRWKGWENFVVDGNDRYTVNVEFTPFDEPHKVILEKLYDCFDRPSNPRKDRLEFTIDEIVSMRYLKPKVGGKCGVRKKAKAKVS